MKLNEKIRIIRKARGISQMDLGFLLSKNGVSRQAISNWENGTFEPKLDNLKEIAKALNVSVEALIDDEVDLSNPLILQEVLNNDYKKEGEHKACFYYSIYRSYKVISFIIGLIVVGVFLGLFIYGNALMNSLTISTIDEPEPASNILSGLNELQDYVTQVASRDQELQNNMRVMFQYVTYISLALMIAFLFVFVFIAIKAKKKIALLSQSSLVIYHKTPVYIKLEDIEFIKKEKFGLSIKTKQEIHRLMFVSNSEEVVNTFYQFKLLKDVM